MYAHCSCLKTGIQLLAVHASVLQPCRLEKIGAGMSRRIAEDAQDARNGWRRGVYRLFRFRPKNGLFSEFSGPLGGNRRTSRDPWRPKRSGKSCFRHRDMRRVHGWNARNWRLLRICAYTYLRRYADTRGEHAEGGIPCRPVQLRSELPGFPHRAMRAAHACRVGFSGRDRTRKRSLVLLSPKCAGIAHEGDERAGRRSVPAVATGVSLAAGVPPALRDGPCGRRDAP